MALAPWFLVGCFHTFDESTDGATTSSGPNDGSGADAASPTSLRDGGDETTLETGEETMDGGSDGAVRAPDSGADATVLVDAQKPDGAGPDGDAGSPPQCVSDGGGTLRVRFTDGFEAYPLGTLVDAGSMWVEAKFGRDAVVANQWPHSGSQDLMIDSFTTRSEVIYVSPFQSPPRRVVVELWSTPDGYYVYEDFVELGLGYAASPYDLRPTVALKLYNHSVFVVSDPTPPATDGGPPPSGSELQNTIPFASSFNGPLVATYLRFDFDLCAAQLDAFVGSAPDAGTHKTASFHGERAITSVYLAGGLNPTYVDDLVISADDGP